MAVARRPGLLARALSYIDPRAPQRVIWPQLAADQTITLEHHGVDLLGQTWGTAASRRMQRSPAQISASYAAVWAAIRWREQAVSKPRLVAQRRVGSEWQELDTHPALEALERVNDSLTDAQGMGLIERQKLTYGESYLVKLRDRLGVVREFDFLDPSNTAPVRDPVRPHRPIAFVTRNPDGTETRRDREEVIWFRHVVHPADPLISLTPIGAVRIAADMALEGMRWNERLFDNGVQAGGYISGNINPNEEARLQQQLRGEWMGTDNAHRWHILSGEDLKVEPSPISNRDLEFMGLMQWGVEEVARAFELSPIALKDFRRATYENADQALAEDWTTAATALDNILKEYTEWCVKPDFGEDVRIIADYAEIPALQEDSKFRAEVDEIELRAGKVTINELRERDGLDSVPWGDAGAVGGLAEAVGALVRAGFEPQAALAVVGMPPVEHLGLPPITVQGADQGLAPGGGSDDGPRSSAASARSVPVTPSTAGEPDLLSLERRAAELWASILTRELRRILRHLGAADEDDRSRVEPGDVDVYDWSGWRERYGPEITALIRDTFIAVLRDHDFVETPLLSARTYAEGWAEQEAGELIALQGSRSVVRTTRNRVRELVAQTIGKGESMRTLKNALRADFAFSPARAETIARTEMAMAVGQGARAAALSQGRDEKRWRTARDERVDGGDASGPCIDNASQGWIGGNEYFYSGHDTVPAHPRCRCDVEWRTASLQQRAVRKNIIRDEQGRIAAVEEVLR